MGSAQMELLFEGPIACNKHHGPVYGNRQVLFSGMNFLMVKLGKGGSLEYNDDLIIFSDFDGAGQPIHLDDTGLSMKDFWYLEERHDGSSVIAESCGINLVITKDGYIEKRNKSKYELT